MGGDIIRIDPKNGKWQSEIVSRFDANQKFFIPNWRKRYPTTKLIFRLRINDLIMYRNTEEIFRIQKISKGNITIAPHNEANVDSRSRDTNDTFTLKSVSASSLQAQGGVKIHISPTGMISKEG